MKSLLCLNSHFSCLVTIFPQKVEQLEQRGECSNFLLFRCSLENILWLRCTLSSLVMSFFLQLDVTFFFHTIFIVEIHSFFFKTRSYAALRAADLEWIVGQGYSLGGYTLEKHHEKPTWNHETKTLHTRGHK